MQWAYSNAAGATLLITFSPVHIGVILLTTFSPVHIHTPRNSTFFLKEHLRKAAEATCTYFSVTALHFKTQKHIQHLIKHFFSKNSSLDVWLGTEYPSGKKLFKVLTFLNPSIKFVTILKEIQKCPECQISWTLEYISILGTNLPKCIILGQDQQFQVLYS